MDTYDLSYKSQEEIVFVEATLNDFDSNQTIKIKKNLPGDETVTFNGINDAKVSLSLNGNENIKCTFTKDGNYRLPSDFKIQVNKPYQLSIELANGKKYMSNMQTANIVPDIDSLFSIYEKKNTEYENTTLDGYKVYLNVNDPLATDNYYAWDYKFYEKKDACRSCEGGKFYVTPLPVGKCVEDAILSRAGVTYDYFCNQNCWAIFSSDKINVLSDQFYKGKTIENRLVADIPYLQYRGVLVEVFQYGLNREAFEYYDALLSQAQKTGALTDTPPVPLIGNLRNVKNSFDGLGGIFTVSSKKVKRLWINRSDPHSFPRFYGLLPGGRALRPEPHDPLDYNRPPLAPCIESANTTGKMPIEWRN